ncbi:nuclear pore complex protein NUP1-like isoform X1 [Zingiber officinale]|uniref:nuclear pore complex protein NUP1-like isoform X1 n=2 Tax=Zingiber officinale TaxID=94328 RepID=UPI001C4A99CD|nr:nuclear pore complex protein NUP1-like isoform X1 [Zingiber officinale]
MEMRPYGGGIGGKLRRKPLRKVAKTPYDRSPTSVSSIRDPEEGSWLGRLVNSVSRLFSSVLPKRLSARPVQGVPVIGGTSLSQSAQVTGAISHELSGELPENKINNQNIAANNPADNIILEFEQFIKQKSFTRAQCEHLISILQSRIVDSDSMKSGASGMKNDDVVVPLRATISHQESIPDDHTVPSVELAREYMRFKIPNASPLHQNLQNHMFHENKQVQSNSNSAKKFSLNGQKPPILSHVSAEIPENNYFTPGSVRTSGIYKMPGSSYVKGEGSSKDGYVGSLSLKTSGTNQNVGQVLKRRNSTLYDKFRSTCPIRRVRQKLGLNSSKRIIHSVLPGNVELCTSTVFKKDFQDNPSPNQRLNCLDGHEESIFKKRSSCDIAPALAQSTKMENQIFQHLHELAPSPKRKSLDNPLDVTIADGFIYSLSHNQEGVGVLEEDASTSSGVKSINATNDINLVPGAATIHGNNAVDAGISNCKAISGNHKPSFQKRESEDKVMDPSSQLKHEDESNISQHKAIPSTRTEGSPPTVLANFPSTSVFSKASDLKPSIDSVAKYSKGFTFPSMPSSLTSQPPPTPTMPRPLVQKLVTQKEHGMTPSFTSASMGAKRALFSLPTTKDNSHASMLENGTRLSNNSTSYVAGIFSTIPTLDFGSTSLIISSALASQPLNVVNDTNLEGKPHNESPVNSNSSSHDNTTLFNFGSKSSASAAVSQFPGTDSGSVLAATSLPNSAVGSTAASSLPPDSRNPSSLAAKTLSDGSNNLNFISSKSNKLDSLYPDNSANSLSSVNVTGFGGTRATQVESPTSQNSTSASLFQLTYGNKVNSGFDMATSTGPSIGNSSAAVSSLFPSARGSQSAFSPTLLGASDHKFNFSSTKFDNLALSDLHNGGKTSPLATSPGFAGTLSTQVESGSYDSLASQVQSTSGHRADGCAVSAAPSISSFAITSSLASSLFLHASGSQLTVAPTTISGASNNLFSFISKPRDTGSSILDNTQQSLPGVIVTGFSRTPPTQVQSGTSLISSSLTSQPQSFIPSSTMGMDISSSSSLGSSFFGTVCNPFISSSSFPMDAVFSSPCTAAAATTFPLATISNLFGLNSKPPTLPTSGLFVSSASSQNSGFPFSTPFIFNSSSNLASSFSSAASTSSVFSRHPTFGLQNSAAGTSTAGGNEMSIEETGDNNQLADSMFQHLGQPGTSPAGPVFSVPAVQPASPVFQFAGQQNFPSPVPPKFQPSGSVEFPQGGSFAFGSGGGGVDKSSRRIIRVRKDKMRKK